jgi:hypothetical protein
MMGWEIVRCGELKFIGIMAFAAALGPPELCFIFIRTHLEKSMDEDSVAQFSREAEWKIKFLLCAYLQDSPMASSNFLTFDAAGRPTGEVHCRAALA